jgi:type IV pilus assembly protein PilF
MFGLEAFVGGGFHGLRRVLCASGVPGAVLVLALLLGACAATSEPGDVMVPAGDRRDLVTASDETRAEKSARIRVELGAAYYSQGQYTTALDEVKRALSADPNHVGAFNLRGLVYAALNEHALADDSFRRALQIAPNNPDTRHNYGWYLCGVRRYAEASAQFAAALALPQYREPAKTWQAQGLCEARAGNLAEAEASLQRSYGIDSSNAGTAFNLAELALRRGDAERARFYVGRVNATPEQVTADSLWLAMRIERRRGNPAGVAELGRQLRSRFPQSRPAQAYERGLFDE